MFFLLPFLTSMGALLYEFSLAQFIGMTIGNSSFGYAFVVGTFLLSMGLGSWLSGMKFLSQTNPQVLLFNLEMFLTGVCLLTLPFLSLVMGWVSGLYLGLSNCESLICSNSGIVLVVLGLFFLFLMGFGVGMEIPLYLRIFPEKLSTILAGDYVGAFFAGILFPLFMLPKLGLMKTFILGSSLHFLVVIYLIFKTSNSKARTAFFGLMFVLVLGSFMFSKKIEIFCLEALLRVPFSTQQRVLMYEHTQKQSVFFVEHEYQNGKKDQMLYLDGFLQFSTLGSLNPYHEVMTQARKKVLSATQAILILGGGDGVLAHYLLKENPKDLIHVVDYDCELLELFKKNTYLRELSPLAWSSSSVQMTCADAFWYVQSPKAFAKKWDFIFVDFPHTSGDAAAAKVETYDFFLSLNRILKIGGYLLLHHEEAESQAQKCVQKNVELAGFAVETKNIKGMAILQAQKVNYNEEEKQRAFFFVDGLQTVLRQPCYEMHGI